MTTAVFHGSLAKRWGKTHEFNANTVFLLCQGLALQLGDEFKQHFIENSWTIVIGKPAKDKSNAISEEQVHQRFGKDNEVHFYPVVAGESGGVRVVLGVVGMIVGAYTGQTWLIQLGAGMALGGVAEMLSPIPSMPSMDGGSNNPNYFFNGGTNTNEQGVPVPLVFGRVTRAGSVVISQGISVETVV